MAACRMLGLVGLQMNMSARNRTLNRRAPTPFPALQQATATPSLMKIVLNAVAVWLHLFCGEEGKVSSYIGEKQYTNGGCSRKVGALEERRWSEGKGKRKSKRFEEKTEQGERQRERDREEGRETHRERHRGRERERQSEQRTDNASGVVPFMFPSYGTLTAVLPAQPAMIKYLQHVENKGSARTLKMF